AAPDPAVAREQEHLTMLLAHVDAARDRLTRRLGEVQRRTADIDHPQALLERDHEYHEISRRLDEYSAAEIGLFFGRIDVDDEDPENPVPGHPDRDRRYIGRIGLHTDDDEMRTLLMDWRAPMARPFYLATTLRPDGVHTRRHIRTRGRTVTGVFDERLGGGDGSPAGPADPADATRHRGAVAREEALLDAVTRARTLHMTDIVDTIAAEQDLIIREDHRGVTVVQGGPGTGKTAVALHRTAYLLYKWRRQLETQGVLIIGPSPRFLSYISQVLPSLGETGVVLATPGTLLPGLTTRPLSDESLTAQEVKGSGEMVHILGRAVAARQTVPDAPVELSVDGVAVTLTPAMVRTARTRARRSRRPHNLARPRFTETVLDQLAEALAETLGANPLGGPNLLTPHDREELRADLADDPGVAAELDALWPALTPEGLLADLYSDPVLLDAAAAEYDDLTRDALRRPEAPDDWTEADAPLLDELAVLLGVPDREEEDAGAEAAWRERIAEAQEALDILAGSASQDVDESGRDMAHDSTDAEILMAYDVIDAETLAARQQVRDTRTTAQRAAADRDWAYGHVIVDEAQELSVMAWRMIFRRSPNRWMTVVGDPAQTGNPAGVETWAETLGPFVDDRWRLHELTVNYRTPGDIAAIAGDLLARVSPGQTAPSALRRTGTGVRSAPRADAAAAVARARELAGDGLVGVIGTPRTVAALRAEGVGAGAGPADGAASEVVVTDVAGAKGLEFDEVVLVEPAEIVEDSPQGLNDVYVAVTRATQGLTVLHDRDLPWSVTTG
ncbi:HelD family protein, partial [Corynebacterium bovis]|uniref:HelD family protein n=1 Tax=Corynebacterium bovis TaxID=36808 RepID=UPI00313964BB